MKIKDRALGWVGLGPERSMPAPEYLSISDGLLITERAAEAWFVLPTINADLASDPDRELEMRDIIAAAERILEGRLLHLRVVWGRITGENYTDELCPDPDAPGRAWVEERAARIDELGLPQRHVLLGVHLEDRSTSSTAEIRGRGAARLYGPGARTVSRSETRRLDAIMRKMGARLAATPWRATPASAETLAWMIGREQHRTATAVPRDGTISGTQLARLTEGRVEPYSDHLRIYDGHGQVVAYTAVMCLTGFPEEMEFPGEGEWLRSLGSITRVRDDIDEDDDEPVEVEVLPEVSMRFRLMSRRESKKRVEAVRTLAKEQRRSAAKGAAEEVDDEVGESEALARQLNLEISRQGLTLVEDHPRILVTEPTLEALYGACAAIDDHYAGSGITCEVGFDEQRELWLEAMLGDSLRVPDLGHTHDIQGLFGSSWWAGSLVGDASGPVIGYLTGSTPGLVRFSAHAGSALGDATTTFASGRSGRGKTTVLMQVMLDSAADGACSNLLDLKGDLGGAVDAAAAFGIPTALIRADETFAGAADLFRVMPPQDAILHVERQLALLAPPAMRETAERHLMPAVSTIASQDVPTSSHVITELIGHTDPEVQALGRYLLGIAGTPLGSTVIGVPRDGQTPRFRTTPGFWLTQFPGLVLPTDPDPSGWSTIERVSMAVFRGFSASTVHAMGDRSLRRMPKVVGIPEVHLLTHLADGRTFLTYVAAMGRALGGSLVLDSQDPQPVIGMSSLLEQITTVISLAQRSTAQCKAAAELLDLDPEDGDVVERIRTLDRTTDGSLRHGHAIMRDRRNNSATIQVDFPSWEVQQMLDTSPQAQAARDERAAAEAEAEAEAAA